jgi:hypothetical protein
MQPRAPMISSKNLGKFMKGAIAAMPAIPYITKRRTSMVLPFVLGGLGVALMGGMAAVMYLSPRTRYRALDMAKTTYGKINTQIGEQLAHLKAKGAEGTSASNGLSNGLANGLSDQNGIGGYSTTGL